MSMSATPLSMIGRVLAVAALALGALETASAEGYDLNKIVSGGGGFGGADPAKRKIALARGAYICLDISQGPGNQVRFVLRSSIPEPNAKIVSINFDTGRHVGLFTGLTVPVQSPGLKFSVVNPRVDASSRNFGTRFAVEFPYEYSKSGKRPKGGLAPGNFVVISANLGPGKTYANVIAALNEAINPTTEATGLRISVPVHNLLGGPPEDIPGGSSIQDDGTFTVRGVSPNCRAR